MSKENIQDFFLNQARKNKTPLQIYLLNGKPLMGKIISFDNFKIILSGKDQQFMIYKHAISTIIPKSPISLQTKEDKEKQHQDGEVDQQCS